MTETPHDQAWEARLISADALAPYAVNGLNIEGDFAARVGMLLRQQKATWPQLREATEGLARAEYRTFQVRGSSVLAQNNPRRMVSTAAKVDTASISARPCFLCPANLPAEEQGIVWDRDYVVLCNPFPVLPDHLVIAHRRHRAQSIGDTFTDFLRLARALGPEFFTLYNGPACGASAPDHLHFQACNRATLPIMRDLVTRETRHVAGPAGVEVFHMPGYRLRTLIARGRDEAALAAWFAATYARLARLTAAGAEPMLNLIAVHDGGEWTVILFPRGRHRPSVYYAEGEEKRTISPAGIDLAGVFIVPHPEHFPRLTDEELEQICEEVTLDSNTFTALISGQE
ncbi:MAG: DUF4922 domain-containing protein [Blastocatellia bacterium]